jgi:putative drug exporter of the RND superfamily
VNRPTSVNALYEGLGRFVVRFRWFVVLFWLVAAIVTGAALPSIGSEVNNNNSAFLSSSEPSSKAATLATPLLGSGVNGGVQDITIVASRASGQLTSADLSAIQREVVLTRNVQMVRSSQLAGLSADGGAAQIRVRADVNGGDPQTAVTIVNALQATFPKAGAPPGLGLHLAGQIAILAANQASSNKSSRELQGISFLFIILLLLFVFRSLPAALVTLIPSGLALVIAGRVIGAEGSAGLQISSITQILLIILMLGAGTDYGLFLVFRVREELRDGQEPHEAVTRAVVRVGESITASAGTVIIALLTLLLATFGLYKDLGVPLASGVAVMLAIGLTLLPALLAILGRKAFWPSKINPGEQKEGVWGRVATALVSRPKTTLGVGVLVFLALAAGALGYKAGGFGGDQNAPKGSDAALGGAALARHFPQTSSNPANLILSYGGSVWSDTSGIASAEASLHGSGAFSQLAGPLNPNGTTLTATQLGTLYRRLGPPQKLATDPPLVPGFTSAQLNAYRADALFVSAGGRVIQFEASLAAGGQGTTAAMHATPNIRDVLSAAGRASGASETGVAGEAAAVYDINKTANHDLSVVVPVAIIAIGLLLALVLRSLVAPLYLIVSVGLSFLAALGLTTIVFIDFGGQGGISFILPFLLFIFLLALGEDYNILVMTRIREESHDLPLREAVIKAISRTGSTVTSAGMILGGTFAVFGIVGGGGSGGDQLRAIGLGLASGILMDTFLVRTLLVPAVVILLGRWNWWPSHLAMAEHAENIEQGA